MRKKHKLVIPDMINKEDSKTSEVLQKHELDGKIIELNSINDTCGFWHGWRIKRNWLQEIKELSYAECEKYIETIIERKDEECQRCYVQGIREGWNAAIENEKLKEVNHD